MRSRSSIWDLFNPSHWSLQRYRVLVDSGSAKFILFWLLTRLHNHVVANGSDCFMSIETKTYTGRVGRISYIVCIYDELSIHRAEGLETKT